MISKQYVYSEVLPLIQEKGRKIDYLLVQSLFENKDIELIEELKKYQNLDGGFGDGLEPDVQSKYSNIVSTNMAIQILDQIRDPKLVQPFIEDIVAYFESMYDEEKDGFKLVTKINMDEPHALWWNVEDYDKNFLYGNPDGIVIGYLFKHRKYLKSLDINKQVNNMITFILSKDFEESSFHTLLSVMEFNLYMDQDVQNLIHERIHQQVNRLIVTDNFEEYGLEPHKVYLTDAHFTKMHTKALYKNLDHIKELVENKKVMPNWQWYQFEEVFDSVKYQWMGYIYFSYIKALRHHRNL